MKTIDYDRLVKDINDGIKDAVAENDSPTFIVLQSFRTLVDQYVIDGDENEKE